MGRRLVDFLSTELPARLSALESEQRLAFDVSLVGRLYTLLREIDEGATDDGTLESLQELMTSAVCSVLSGEFAGTRGELLSSVQAVFPEPTDDCPAYFYSNVGLALYNITRVQTYKDESKLGFVASLAVGGVQGNEDTMPIDPSPNDVGLVSREVGALDDALDEIVIPFLAWLLRVLARIEAGPEAASAVLSELLQEIERVA